MIPANRTKAHTFTITLRFDKPLTKKQALYEARNNIHGTFYCDSRNHDAGLFRVSSIRPARRPT